MSTFRALSLVRPALALGVALGLGGCDDPQPPSGMVLIHAVSNPGGDRQAAGAAFTGAAMRDQMQMYFGERFADEQRALSQQPQLATAEVPTF